MLSIKWPETTFKWYLADNYFDVGVGNAELYVFLVWAPVLLFVSWLLEIAVDNPAV